MQLVTSYCGHGKGVYCFQRPRREDVGVGEAKFFMIWQFKGGNWKLSRVISYDHAVAKP